MNVDNMNHIIVKRILNSITYLDLNCIAKFSNRHSGLSHQTETATRRKKSKTKTTKEGRKWINGDKLEKMPIYVQKTQEGREIVIY